MPARVPRPVPDGKGRIRAEGWYGRPRGVIRNLRGAIGAYPVGQGEEALDLARRAVGGVEQP